MLAPSSLHVQLRDNSLHRPLQVKQQIGQGGASTTWKAELEGTTVCLKVLHTRCVCLV